MRIEIETLDIDAAAARAAEAELRRIAERMEPGYYKRVAEGAMPRAEANARLKAMATATMLCQAAAIALEEAARPAQGELAASVAAALAAIPPRELPYDKGASVRDEPPLCRLCLHPGEHDGHAGWRCTRPECLAHSGWTTRKLFEGSAV